jgi:hypothetical protein
MLNRNGPNLGMPLFFKLWFAFVGTIVLTITGGMFYFLFLVAKAGPEGIGREVGSFVKALKDASDAR